MIYLFVSSHVSIEQFEYSFSHFHIDTLNCLVYNQSTTVKEDLNMHNVYIEPQSYELEFLTEMDLSF